MPVVVSDTSVIRALALLDRIPLLTGLYTDVRVPPAVVQELAQPRIGRAVAEQDLVGITIQSPRDRGRVTELRCRLDAGESEAIALALEIHADQILIDDKAGRSVATEVHLPCIGTLGVLLLAKRRGFVDRIQPLIERLKTELNSYMSEDLQRTILRQAGEEVTNE